MVVGSLKSILAASCRTSTASLAAIPGRRHGVSCEKMLSRPVKRRHVSIGRCFDRAIGPELRAACPTVGP